MDEEVVQAGRRHVVAQHFQQRAGIAVRERDFLPGEAALGELPRPGMEDRMVGSR